MSDTIKVDSTNNRLEALVEIYRMMRPGEPQLRRQRKICLLIFSFPRKDTTSPCRPDEV